MKLSKCSVEVAMISTAPSHPCCIENLTNITNRFFRCGGVAMWSVAQYRNGPDFVHLNDVEQFMAEHAEMDLYAYHIV